MLTITRNKLKDDKSFDLLVVMMNPGGSSPKDSNKWQNTPITNINDLVEAIPDDTQLQIMKVMDKTGYKNTLVLNLSDICETVSNKFVKDINGCVYSDFDESHSIFSEQRHEELLMVLSHFSGDTVILASGVNYKLRFLTNQMISKIKYPNLISKPHENGLFYHPLPRGGQEAWVEYIVNKLEQS